MKKNKKEQLEEVQNENLNETQDQPEEVNTQSETVENNETAEQVQNEPVQQPSESEEQKQSEQEITAQSQESEDNSQSSDVEQNGEQSFFKKALNGTVNFFKKVPGFFKKIPSFFKSIPSRLKNAPDVLKKIPQVFSLNRVGLFILIPAFILCFIAPFMHKAGFGGTLYFNTTAFVLPIVGVIISIVLSVIKYTARYGGLAMFITSLVSLLAFIAVAYLHLGSAFFSGIPDTLGGILEAMGVHFSYCLIGYVLSMILSIVSMFFPDPISKSIKD